jgi:hypothetical protein
MLKKAIIITLCLLLVVLSLGCFGGNSPPTLKESLTSLDTAIVNYESVKSMYYSGNLTVAKEQFIAIAATFKSCQSELDAASKRDLTTLEKRDAANLAGAAGQFAYAAQYMRDACTESMKKGDNNAYLFKVTADEYEIIARSNYETNKEELERAWSSGK